MTTTTRRPRALVEDAQRILNGMTQLERDLIALGDTRGAEITRILVDQWRYRAKAIQRDTCETCGGFRGKCNEWARCTCPQTKRKQ
jgi:hypothetical protein